jgi:hypothetical protein
MSLSVCSFLQAQQPCKKIAFQDADNALAGHYLLENIMETGSELLLEKNGQFKWYLTTGALEQYAEGTWWKNKNCIGLKASSKYVPYLMIFPTRLDINSHQKLNITWSNGSMEGSYVKTTSP